MNAEQRMEQQPATVRLNVRHSGQIAATDEASRSAAAAYFQTMLPWHEAAHAITALALGGSVSLITLDPDEAQRVCDADETCRRHARLHALTQTPTPSDPEARGRTA